MNAENVSLAMPRGAPQDMVSLRGYNSFSIDPIPGCNDALRIKLPFDGSSAVEWFPIRPGLVVATVSMNLTMDVAIDYGGQDAVTLRFVLDGVSQWSSCASDVALSGPHMTVFAPTPEATYRVVIKKRTPQHVVTITADRSLLIDEFGFPEDRVNYGNLPVPYRLNPPLQTLTRDILANHFTGPRRASYAASLGSSLLCLVGDYLEREDQLAFPKAKIGDEKRLIAARQVIAERFRAPPAIKEIARQVGLSESKLTSGFKLRFGETLGECARRLRLEAARDLLRVRTGRIDVVAAEVGYRHLSSFSAAFSAHFGYPPGSTSKAWL